MAVSDPVALLRRLVKEPAESDWLEFKQNNNDPEVIGSWISACANAAILAGKERAFMVFGVQNVTRTLLGTTVNLSAMKKGAENFVNWISRVIEPRLMMEFLDFKHNGLQFAILAIEPTYDRPVKFLGTEYIRIGENIKKLAEFPDHERSVWIATGRRKFEGAIAASHQSIPEILDKLDADTFYKLVGEQRPKVLEEVIRRFELCEFIKDDLEGGFHITNLGALVLAKSLKSFGSVASHLAMATRC